MNYIPGFSNYLETTVPEYGPVATTPAATTPAATTPTATTPAATTPYTLSGLTPEALAGLYALSSSGNFNQGNYGSDFGSLDDVYGMNFGSDFGSGGSGGSLFKVNPYLQTFVAPQSDKGNSTAYGGNIEVKSPTQVFRLLDKNTGQVVYEGVGYEGAQEAINRASALTAEQGAKAQWQIQTPNSQQESGYSVVANEKRSQSTLGDIASVALPIGMAILTGGMSLPAQMAGAAMAGAAGAGLAGKNPAKAGLISAATAGIMGGSGANKAIGRAVGNIGGALAAKTTEELGKTAAEKAAEQIIVTGLSKAAQGAGSAIGNTLLSQGVKGGLSEVTGYKTPAEKFAQQPSPVAEPMAVAPEVPYDGIRVIGPKLASASGLPFAAAFPVPVNAMLSGALTAAQPTPAEQPKTAEEIEAEKNPMVVTGPKNLLPADFATSAAAAAAANAANGMADAPDRAEMTDEELDAYMNDVSKGGGLENYLGIAGKAVGLLGNLTGGGKGGSGSGGLGTYVPGGAGSGRLNPIFSAQLPAAGGLGTIGATRTARPLGDVDWLTYGMRPELKFFDYSTTPANPAPVTTPVPGNPAGPIMTTPAAGMIPAPDQKLTPAQLADLERQSLAQTAYLSQFAGPTAEELARNTALYSTTGEPIMEEPTRMMAKGGAFAAKRGGRSQRSEFAVNGPGTGRSDDIPAVLSDGEYVIDAETVALLGDGSSKAGAKKLDELRVKVRKHKGKKLAKGRFSANAKKPEAYLSGGRI